MADATKHARKRSAKHYVELAVSFRLEASHQLHRAPEDSVCRRLHGHSWVIDVHVAGAVDMDSGWLLDYHDIERAWVPVHDALDHRNLNDVAGLDNPTSELLAIWIWDRLAASLPGLLKITVHETCTARCSYFGPGRDTEDGA